MANAVMPLAQSRRGITAKRREERQVETSTKYRPRRPIRQGHKSTRTSTTQQEKKGTLRDGEERKCRWMERFAVNTGQEEMGLGSGGVIMQPAIAQTQTLKLDIKSRGFYLVLVIFPNTPADDLEFKAHSAPAGRSQKLV